MQRFIGGSSLPKKLKIETKPDTWRLRQTDAARLFVHGGPIEPHIVRTEGISPAHSRELLKIGDEVIGGGRMLFAFVIGINHNMPPEREKPSAVGRFWGYDAPSYVFLVPPGTDFWSNQGQIAHAAEVAFEYVVEPTDIVEYWAPSNRYRYNYLVDRKSVEPPNPRNNFQHVIWQDYLQTLLRSLANI